MRLDRLLPERRQQLVEFASLESGRVGRGFGRLRSRGWPVLQTALAAGLAWPFARYVLGRPQHPGDEERLGEAAREAAARASAVLDRDENVSVSMIVAQVQATAVDALRSLGVERLDAHEQIGEVAWTAQADGAESDAPGGDREPASAGKPGFDFE